MGFFKNFLEAILWFAVDYDGNIFVYRELYTWNGKPNEGTGETAVQIGKKICQLEKSDENISYGVLDSACWQRNGVTGVTIAEAINNELYAAKLVTFGKSSKCRLEGANAIKKNPELPDTNGEDHLMDAICYGLMSRPYAPTKIKSIIRDGYRREESPSAWSI